MINQKIFSRLQSNKLASFLVIGSILFVSISISILVPQTTSALSGWNPGNIISDTVFTNKDAMNVSQIQQFLNSKVSSCDTWGTQTSEYGGGTRRQWAEARGYYPPYTCLKDYVDGGKSSAQVIYDAAQEFAINPQVLIVLLQKEQGLVTDTWPVPIQYRSATGYGCPDTAPCDAQYYGLTNQVRWSARMFRAIMNASPTWYTPYLVGNNYIQYNPDTSCGGSNVVIQNRSTQALYNYTPYQPNQGALDAGWGTAHCGAYGNRNFYLYFTNWFGSPQDNSPLVVSPVTTSTNLAGTGQPIYVSYTVRNPANYPIVVPSIGVSNRLNGAFYDFNISTNVSFAANETKTFNGVFFPGSSGNYVMTTVYNMSSNWWGGSSTTVAVEKPVLSQATALKVSPEFPLVNSPHQVSYAIKNTGRVEAHLTYVMAANTSNGSGLGYKADTNVILAPGQTYTYTDTRTATSTAQQRSWISYMLPTGEWQGTGNPVNFRSYATPAKTEISQELTTNPQYPVVNTPTEATFKVKNTGDQPIRFNNIGISVTRISDGAKFDYTSQPSGGPIIINGNSEFTYRASRTLPSKDLYTFDITGSIDGTSWNSAYVGDNSPAEKKTKSIQTFSSPANIQVMTPLVSMTKKQGEITTLSYKVKNTGDQPTGNMSVAFYCRFNQLYYCDIPGDTVNLSGGSEHTVTRTVSYTGQGDYTIRPLQYFNGAWREFSTPSTLTIQPFQPSQSTFTSSLSLSSNTTTVGTPITATYTLRNNTGVDLQVPRHAVAARLNGFYDFGFNNWFFIRAGETKTFTSQFTPTRSGTFELFPVTLINDTWIGHNKQNLVVQ